MDIETEIKKIENRIGFSFPKMYREFISTIEIDTVFEIRNTGISLYSISDLLERNETYEIPIYEPNYFLIGQDGDLAFFINKNGEEMIFSNDLGAIGSLEMEFESENIDDFLKKEI